MSRVVDSAALLGAILVSARVRRFRQETPCGYCFRSKGFEGRTPPMRLGSRGKPEGIPFHSTASCGATSEAKEEHMDSTKADAMVQTRGV